MKQNMKRLICLLLMVVLLAPAAQAAVNAEKKASLTVQFPHVGTGFELYRVADIGVGDHYVKTEPFQSCPMDLGDLRADEMSALADTLTGYVQLWRLPAVAVGTIGWDGTTIFSGLTPGLYLLCAGTVTVHGTAYTARPLLVCLPMEHMQNGTWIYDVTVSPKPGELDPAGGDTTISRKVLKVWADGEHAALRPDSITIHLLRDGELFDTVKLTSQDNWRYRWDDLAVNHVWTVVEEPIPGYSVTVEQQGITFVITNTRDFDPGTDPEPKPSTSPVIDPEPTPSSQPTPGLDPAPTPSMQPTPEPSVDPDIPTLPQTGLLWWPVPVLAFAGLLLFLLGWVRSRREDDEA